MSMTIESIKKMHIKRGDWVMIEVGDCTTEADEARMRAVLEPFFKERGAVFGVSRSGNDLRQLTCD